MTNTGRKRRKGIQRFIHAFLFIIRFGCFGFAGRGALPKSNHPPLPHLRFFLPPKRASEEASKRARASPPYLPLSGNCTARRHLYTAIFFT